MEGGLIVAIFPWAMILVPAGEVEPAEGEIPACLLALRGRVSRGCESVGRQLEQRGVGSDSGDNGRTLERRRRLLVSGEQSWRPAMIEGY